MTEYNRFHSCLRFARKSAVRTNSNVSVLVLPNGRFRAIFTEAAFELRLEDLIVLTINPKRRRRRVHPYIQQKGQSNEQH